MDLRRDFIHQLWRYKNGSISRRHFLGTTGLGMATAVLASAMPGLKPRRAFAGDIGDKVGLCTWPSYHDENNFKAFKEATGADVEVTTFGSNEEMMAKLQAGATGWD
ncbi:MAG: twin-arginine translocation signal domain-containing protein, partial [Dongiaceae bacterium]